MWASFVAVVAATLGMHESATQPATQTTPTITSTPTTSATSTISLPPQHFSMAQPSEWNSLIAFESTVITRLELNHGAGISGSAFVNLSLSTSGGVSLGITATITIVSLNGESTSVPVPASVYVADTFAITSDLADHQFESLVLEISYAILPGSADVTQTHAVQVQSSATLSREGFIQEIQFAGTGRFRVGSPHLEYQYSANTLDFQVGSDITTALIMSNGNNVVDLDAYDIVAQFTIPEHLSLDSVICTTSDATGLETSTISCPSSTSLIGNSSTLLLNVDELLRGFVVTANLTFTIAHSEFGVEIGWGRNEGLWLQTYDGVKNLTPLGYSGAPVSGAVVYHAHPFLGRISSPYAVEFSIETPAADPDGLRLVSKYDDISAMLLIRIPRGFGEISATMPLPHFDGSQLVHCAGASVHDADGVLSVDGSNISVSASDRNGNLTVGLGVVNNDIVGTDRELQLKIFMVVSEHMAAQEQGNRWDVSLPHVEVWSSGQVSIVPGGRLEAVSPTIEILLDSQFRNRPDSGDNIDYTARISHPVSNATLPVFDVHLNISVDPWVVIMSARCEPAVCSLSYPDDAGFMVMLSSIPYSTVVNVIWETMIINHVPSDLKIESSVVGSYTTVAEHSSACLNQPSAEDIVAVTQQSGPIAVPQMQIALIGSSLPINRVGKHGIIPGEQIDARVTATIPETNGTYTAVIRVQAPMFIHSCSLTSAIGVVTDGRNLLDVQSVSSEEQRVVTFDLGEVTLPDAPASDGTNAGVILFELQFELREDAEVFVSRNGVLKVDAEIGFESESDSSYHLDVEEPIVQITGSPMQFMDALDVMNHEMAIMQHPHKDNTPKFAYDLDVSYDFDPIFLVHHDSVMGCLYHRTSPLNPASIWSPFACESAGGTIVPKTIIHSNSYRWSMPGLMNSTAIFHVVGNTTTIQLAESGVSYYNRGVANFSSIDDITSVLGRRYTTPKSFRSTVTTPTVTTSVMSRNLQTTFQPSQLHRIGEVVHVRTSTTFPEGSTMDFILDITFPNGLQLISVNVSHVDALLIRGTPLVGDVLTPLRQVVSYESDDSSESGSGSGDLSDEVIHCTIRATFGNTTHEPKIIVAAPEVVNIAGGLQNDLIQLDALVIVRNYSGNTGIIPATTIVPTASASWGSLGQSHSSISPMPLIEPEILINLHHDHGTSVDGDDSVAYFLRIEHSHRSRADAYEIEVIIQLPPHFISLSASTYVHDIHFGNETCEIAHVFETNITVYCARFPVEQGHIIVHFDALVLNSISPNTTSFVDGNVMYTTIDYGSIVDGEYTGREKYGTAISNAIISSVPKVNIYIEDTSLATTASNEVTISEMISYQIILDIPEVTCNLTVGFNIPPELDCESITVIGIGSSLSVGFPINSSLGCDLPLNNHLGIVENNPDNNATSDDWLIFEVFVQVQDVLTAYESVYLTTTAMYLCNDVISISRGVSSDSSAVIVEPHITLSTDITTTGPFDAKNLVDFTVLIQYVSSSKATAYNVIGSAQLSFGIEVIESVRLADNGTATLLEYEGDTILWNLPILDRHSFFGIVVTGRVQQHVYPGMPLTINASSVFDSHPDPIPQQAAMHPRNFDGRLYSLQSATDPIAVAHPNMNISRYNSTTHSTTDSTVATIGELVEARLHLTLPEATIDSVALALNLTENHEHRMVELLSARITHVGGNIYCSNITDPFSKKLGPSNWSSSAVLLLGECVNVADNITDRNDTIVVDAIFVLRDVVEVAGGNSFSLDCRLNYNTSLGSYVNTSRLNITVVEPILSTRLWTYPSRSTLDAGDLVNFTLRLQHTGLSYPSYSSTAHEVSTTIELPPQLEFLELQSVNFPHEFTIENKTMTFAIPYFNRLPARNLYFKFSAIVRNNVNAETTNIRCEADSSWNSLAAHVRNETGEEGRIGTSSHRSSRLDFEGLSIRGNIVATSLGGTPVLVPPSSTPVAIGEEVAITASLLVPEVKSEIQVAVNVGGPDNGAIIMRYEVVLGDHISGCDLNNSTGIEQSGSQLIVSFTDWCTNSESRPSSESLESGSDTILITIHVVVLNETSLVEGTDISVNYVATVTKGSGSKDLALGIPMVIQEPKFITSASTPDGSHFEPGDSFTLNLAITVTSFAYDSMLTLLLPDAVFLLNVSKSGTAISTEPASAGDQNVSIFYPELNSGDTILLSVVVQVDESAAPGTHLFSSAEVRFSSAPHWAPAFRLGRLVIPFPPMYVTYLACNFTASTSVDATDSTIRALGEATITTIDCLVRGMGDFVLTVPLQRDDGSNWGCFESVSFGDVGNHVTASLIGIPNISDSEALLHINVTNIATEPWHPNINGDQMEIILRTRAVDDVSIECAATSSLPVPSSAGATGTIEPIVTFGGHSFSNATNFTSVTPMLLMVSFDRSSNISVVEAGDRLNFTTVFTSLGGPYTATALDVTILTSSPFLNNLRISSSTHIFESVAAPDGRDHTGTPPAVGAAFQATISQIYPGETLSVEWSGVLDSSIPHGSPQDEDLQIQYRTVSYADSPAFKYNALNVPARVTTSVKDLHVTATVLPSVTQSNEPYVFGMGEVITHRSMIYVPGGYSEHVRLHLRYNHGGPILSPLVGSARIDTNFSGLFSLDEELDIDELGTHAKLIVLIGSLQGPATYYFDAKFTVISSESQITGLGNISSQVDRSEVNLVGSDNTVYFQVGEPIMSVYSTSITAESLSVDAGDEIIVRHRVCNDDDILSAMAYDLHPSAVVSVPIVSITMNCSCVECVTYPMDEIVQCALVTRLEPGACLDWDFIIELAPYMTPGPPVTVNISVSYNSASTEVGKAFDPIDSMASIDTTKIVISNITALSESTGHTLLTIGESVVFGLDMILPEGTVDDITLSIELLDDGLVFPLLADVGSPLTLSQQGTSYPSYEFGGHITPGIGIAVDRISSSKLILKLDAFVHLESDDLRVRRQLGDKSIRLEVIVLSILSVPFGSRVTIEATIPGAEVVMSTENVVIGRPHLDVVGSMSRVTDPLGLASWVYMFNAVVDHARQSVGDATAVEYDLQPQTATVPNKPFLADYILNVTDTSLQVNGDIFISQNGEMNISARLELLDLNDLTFGDDVCLSISLNYYSPLVSQEWSTAMNALNLSAVGIFDLPQLSCASLLDLSASGASDDGELSIGGIAGAAVAIMLALLLLMVVVLKINKRNAKEDPEAADSEHWLLTAAEVNTISSVAPKILATELPICSLTEDSIPGWNSYRRVIGFDNAYFGNEFNLLTGTQLEDVYAILALPIPRRDVQVLLQSLGRMFLNQKLPIPGKSIQMRTIDDVTLFMMEVLPDLLVERAIDCIASVGITVAERAPISILEADYVEPNALFDLYATIDDDDIYEYVELTMDSDPKANRFLLDAATANGGVGLCLHPKAAIRVPMHETEPMYHMLDGSNEGENESVLWGQEANYALAAGMPVYDIGSNVSMQRGVTRRHPTDTGGATYALAQSDAPDDTYDLAKNDQATYDIAQGTAEDTYDIASNSNVESNYDIAASRTDDAMYDVASQDDEMYSSASATEELPLSNYTGSLAPSTRRISPVLTARRSTDSDMTYSDATTVSGLDTRQTTNISAVYPFEERGVLMPDNFSDVDLEQVSDLVQELERSRTETCSRNTTLHRPRKVVSIEGISDMDYDDLEDGEFELSDEPINRKSSSA